MRLAARTWHAIGRRSAVALVVAGAFLTSETVLSHVRRIGLSGGYGWHRTLAIVLGAGAIIAGAIRLLQTWRGWPSENELAAFARRWTPFVLAATVYMGAFLIMGPTPEGDQPHYELESVGLAYDHTRDMTRNYTSPERFLLVFPLGVPDRHAFVYKRGGELVQGHNVGLPLLLAPAVPWVREVQVLSPGRDRWPWNLEIIVLAALAAQVLYRILRRLRPHKPVLLAGVWAGVVFSAPIVVYASQIYPEIPAMLLALIAVDALLKPPRRSTIVLGACALAFLPWLHVRFLPIAALLALALAVRASAALPAEQRGRAVGVRRVGWAILPLVLSLVVMGIAFQHWYGSPWWGAPSRLPHPPVRTLSASWVALAGGFWSSQRGWLPYAPIAVLALASVGYCARRYLWWTLFGLAVAVAYLLPITIEGSEIGFSFPGRYLVILMPFVALPLLIAATDLAPVRWAVWPLAGLTFYLALAIVLEPPVTVNEVPGVTGPTFPQLLWPWFVHIWPEIVPSAAHFYPDAGAVIGWSSALVAISVAGYFLPLRTADTVSDRIAFTE